LMADSSLNSNSAARTKPRRANTFGPGEGPGAASGVVTWACAPAAGNRILVPRCQSAARRRQHRSRPGPRWHGASLLQVPGMTRCVL
jgi:hypothetical protein